MTHGIFASAINLPIKSQLRRTAVGIQEPVLLLEVIGHKSVASNLTPNGVKQCTALMRRDRETGGESLAPQFPHSSRGPRQRKAETTRAARPTLLAILKTLRHGLTPSLMVRRVLHQGNALSLGQLFRGGLAAEIFLVRINIRVEEEEGRFPTVLLKYTHAMRCADTATRVQEDFTLHVRLGEARRLASKPLERVKLKLEEKVVTANIGDNLLGEIRR